jgi:hypothetical protein
VDSGGITGIWSRETPGVSSTPAPRTLGAGPVASRRRAGPRLHSRLSRHSTAFTRTCVSRMQQALALTQGVATVRMRVVESTIARQQKGSS